MSEGYYLRLNDRNDHSAIAWVGPFDTQEDAGEYTGHSADDYIVVDERNQPEVDDTLEGEDYDTLFPDMDVSAMAEPPR
jgi:hypothetical protein